MSNVVLSYCKIEYWIEYVAFFYLPNTGDSFGNYIYGEMVDFW